MSHALQDPRSGLCQSHGYSCHLLAKSAERSTVALDCKHPRFKELKKIEFLLDRNPKPEPGSPEKQWRASSPGQPGTAVPTFLKSPRAYREPTPGSSTVPNSSISS